MCASRDYDDRFGSVPAVHWTAAADQERTFSSRQTTGNLAPFYDARKLKMMKKERRQSDCECEV